MKGIPLLDRLILPAFIIILLVFGVLVARKFIMTTPTSPAPAAVSQEPRQVREVLLYFGHEDGSHLIAEARQIEQCLEEVACMRATVQALLNGPVGNLVPLFPSHAVIRDFTVEESKAIINFSRAFVAGHPGGSLSELLTVYSLANTLAVNFPHVRQVQILVEGEKVESLKGHVGLHDPIKPDFSLDRTPETSGLPESIPGEPEGSL
jgi:spore germination protein GerM